MFQPNADQVLIASQWAFKTKSIGFAKMENALVRNVMSLTYYNFSREMFFNSLYIIYHNVVSIYILDLVPIQNCLTLHGYGYCKFPFISKGRVFNKCTTFDTDFANRDWCAIDVDSDRNMKDYAYCSNSYKTRCYNTCDGC